MNNKPEPVKEVTGYRDYICPLPPNWKVICAWCSLHMRGSSSARMVSYGICSHCSEKIPAEKEGRIDEP